MKHMKMNHERALTDLRGGACALRFLLTGAKPAASASPSLANAAALVLVESRKGPTPRITEVSSSAVETPSRDACRGVAVLAPEAAAMSLCTSAADALSVAAASPSRPRQVRSMTLGGDDAIAGNARPPQVPRSLLVMPPHLSCATDVVLGLVLAARLPYLRCSAGEKHNGRCRQQMRSSRKTRPQLLKSRRLISHAAAGLSPSPLLVVSLLDAAADAAEALENYDLGVRD